MSKKAMNPVERAEAELNAMEQGLAQMTDPEAVIPPQPVTEPQTPSQIPPEEDPNSETYKSRWHALQGLLNGAREQVKTLSAQNEMLSSRMDQLLARLEQAPPAAPQNPAELEGVLEAYVAQYGEDALAAMQAVSKSAVSQEIQALRAEIAELRGLTSRVDNLAKQQEKSDAEKFMDALTQRVSDWESIHRSVEFQLWKDQTIERYTGKPLSELFDAANQAWNLEAMVAIFNDYKAAFGITNNQPPGNQPPMDPRESLITPGSSNPGQPTGNQPKVWMESDVQAVWDNVRKGRYTEADEQRLMYEIDVAFREGRVRPG